MDWHFLAEGAMARPTATRLVKGEHIGWRWAAGTVAIDLEPFEGGTAITLLNGDLPGEHAQQVAAALGAIEGFALVLSELKVLLETGRAAGLVRAKAKLIAHRR